METLTEIELAQLSAETAMLVDGARWYFNANSGRFMLSKIKENQLFALNDDWHAASEPEGDDLLRGLAAYEYAQNDRKAFALLERLGPTYRYNIYRAEDYSVTILNPEMINGLIRRKGPTLAIAICRTVVDTVKSGIWKPIQGD